MKILKCTHREAVKAVRKIVTGDVENPDNKKYKGVSFSKKLPDGRGVAILIDGAYDNYFVEVANVKKSCRRVGEANDQIMTNPGYKSILVIYQGVEETAAGVLLAADRCIQQSIGEVGILTDEGVKKPVIVERELITSGEIAAGWRKGVDYAGRKI